MQRATEDLAFHLMAHEAILAATLPSLRSVVAVSDIYVGMPARDHVWYAVSKACLQALMLALALDWASDVRCNAVAPGATWSDHDRERAILQSIPLGAWCSQPAQFLWNLKSTAIGRRRPASAPSHTGRSHWRASSSSHGVSASTQVLSRTIKVNPTSSAGDSTAWSRISFSIICAAVTPISRLGVRIVVSRGTV